MTPNKRKWYGPAIRCGQGVAISYRPTTIPGTFAIEANWEVLPVPMGTVWYTWHSQTTIAILDMYVNGFYRRLGVAERLLNRLGLDHPQVKAFTTESATRLSLPVLKHFGFVQREDGGYVFNIPARNKEKRKRK